jgi:hypothetical protein
MKLLTLNRTVAGTVLLAGLASLLSGCSSTGYKKADKTGEGIAQYRKEVVNMKKAVDTTLTCMDQIEITANSNPRPAFERFTKSVAKLDAAASKAAKRSAQMKAEGQAYFRQWEEQMAQVNNPEVKRLAQERKTKLWAAFDGIRSAAEPLKTKFDPWLADLKDLERYLSNDLTVAGVDAARGLFSKAKADGAEVDKAIDALVAELNTIAATVTPANIQKAK